MTSSPPPEPPPTPPPAPTVEERDGRCDWYGLALPPPGGTLTNCSPRAMSSRHEGIGAEALLVQVTEWVREHGGAPQPSDGDPTFAIGEIRFTVTAFADTEAKAADIIFTKR